MEQKKPSCARILKIYQDEFTKLANLQEQLGVFGIDDFADGAAREFKLNKICERLNSKGNGKNGNSIKCPKCGGKQLYKGEQMLNKQRK